jgi:hypothetical protein
MYSTEGPSLRRTLGGGSRPRCLARRALERTAEGEPAVSIAADSEGFEIPGDRMALDWGATPAADVGALGRFTALAEASDRTILAFTRRYGALEFCPHGLPRLHPMGWLPGETGDAIYRPCTDWVRQQPTSWYRSEALQLRAIVRLSAALQQGRPGDSSDWTLVRYPWQRAAPLKGKGLWAESDPLERFRSGPQALSIIIDGWIAKAGLGLVCRWDERMGPGIALWARSLWGVLVEQLVTTHLGGNPMTVCSGCSAAFFPTRQRRAGKRAWCDAPECKRAARRQATRDHRARERGEQ